MSRHGKILQHLIKQLARVLLAHGGGHHDPRAHQARVCRNDVLPCHGVLLVLVVMIAPAVLIIRALMAMVDVSVIAWRIYLPCVILFFAYHSVQSSIMIL